MSALAADERVAVAPAYLNVPEWRYTHGDEVADLAAAAGFAPDEEQRMLLRHRYGSMRSGARFQSREARWSAFETATVCARQNLKTAELEMSVLGDLWLLDAQLILWTAHLYNPAAAESFLHFKRLIDANAFLSRRVKRVTEAAGGQGIELMNGARLKFLARSKGQSRSLSADVLIIDEAYELDAAEQGAFLPTMSARPNAQVRYGSSAGRIESEALRAIRDRGRAGSSSMLYAEWCSTRPCEQRNCSHRPGAPGCTGDDEQEWAKANPALGRRISIEAIRAERQAMPPGEFMRERMGWHDDPGGAGSVIPDAMFARLVRDSAIDGPVTVVPEVSMDRGRATIWICGAGPDGVPQVEPADRRAGTEWVAGRVAQIVGRNDVLAVGVRSGGPAASLIGDVERVCADAGVALVKVHSGPMAAFCGQFYDACMGDVAGLRHRGDGPLFEQVKAAKRKRSVDAWSWERSDVDTDMADLVAATAAFGLFVELAAKVPYDPLNNIW